MSEHSFEKDSRVELADATNLVEDLELFAKDDVSLVAVDAAVDTNDTDIKAESTVDADDEHSHLSITPHQFVRKKSGKYEPTVRPNFWIPIIYLLAGIIPYALYFAAAYFIEPYFLPKPFPDSPPPVHGHSGTLTAILYCINVSIPSFIGEVTALILLRKRDLKPWVRILAWLIFMAIACVAFVYISIAAANYWSQS